MELKPWDPSNSHIFPRYAQYVYSSLRPSELNSSYARWTLRDLGIGDSSTGELKLNMTEYADSLVNRVKVMGGYNGNWIETEKFSARSQLVELLFSSIIRY